MNVATTTAEVMTAAEVAELLRVSERTVQRLARAQSDALPHFNAGTGDRPTLRFWRADVLRWIEARRGAQAPSAAPLPKPVFAPVDFAAAKRTGRGKRRT